MKGCVRSVVLESDVFHITRAETYTKNTCSWSPSKWKRRKIHLIEIRLQYGRRHDLFLLITNYAIHSSPLERKNIPDIPIKDSQAQEVSHCKAGIILPPHTSIASNKVISLMLRMGMDTGEQLHVPQNQTRNVFWPHHSWTTLVCTWLCRIAVQTWYTECVEKLRPAYVSDCFQFNSRKSPSGKLNPCKEDERVCWECSPSRTSRMLLFCVGKACQLYLDFKQSRAFQNLRWSMQVAIWQAALSCRKKT